MLIRDEEKAESREWHCRKTERSGLITKAVAALQKLIRQQT